MKINFVDQELGSELFSTAGTLLTTKQMELVRKKELASSVLSPNEEIFMVYIVALSSDLDIYSPCKTQLVSLLIDNISTVVLSKYVNFVNIFSPKFAAELLKYIGINDFSIDLVNGLQPSYGFIYSRDPIKLETLKTYIEINLVNDFIQAFKLTTRVLISFI